MPQLIEKRIIDTPLWSILLVNGREGIFSMGGSSAASVREIEQETADDLNRLGEHQNPERGHITKDLPTRKPADEWKWIKVQGAEGWWQIPMHGVWVDGVKVLDSQLVVLDVSVWKCFRFSCLQLKGQHTLHHRTSFGCQDALLCYIW